MTLLDAQIGEEYIIKDIVTDDEEMDAFLLHWDVTVGNQLL